MPRPHIEFIQSQALPWSPTSWDGALTGTEIKILSRDEDSGACTTVIKYPAGWEREASEHLPVHEELFVLGGTLKINGINYDEMCYAHLPAGYSRTSTASPDGAVVLTFFSGDANSVDGSAPSGLYDQSLLIERVDVLNANFSHDQTNLNVDPDSELGAGVANFGNLVLRTDPYTKNQTWVISAPPLWQNTVIEIHPVVEEMYLLTGELAGDTGMMMPGAYFWRPPHMRHGPFGSKTGNLMLFRTEGSSLETETPEGNESFSWTPEHRPVLPPEMQQYGKTPGHETLCY